MSDLLTKPKDFVSVPDADLDRSPMSLAELFESLGEPQIRSDGTMEFPDSGEGDGADLMSDDTSVPEVTVPEDKPVNDSSEPPPPAETLPTVPETPPAPSTPPAPAITPEIQGQLDAYQALLKQMQQDPVSLLKGLISALPVTDRAALAQEVASEAPALAPVRMEDYDPDTLSEVDKEVLPRMAMVDTIPALTRELGNLKPYVQQRVQELIPHVSEANVAAEIALAKIDALCDAIGLALPDPDVNALVAAIRDGKKTYREGVRSVAKYGDTVAAHKQAKIERPQTPGSQTRSRESLRRGATMAEIMRHEGLL